MPNYTITREIRSVDNYGCTNFATNQKVGQLAQLGNYGGGLNTGQLDGDIVWFIDADQGFTINVDDFEIPNTTPTAVAQTPGIQRTFEGSGLPSPILGVAMEAVSGTRIKVVIFLFPYGPLSISGMPFEMPPNAVNIQVNIVGCAQGGMEGTNLSVVARNASPGGIDPPVVEVVVDPGQEEDLELTTISNNEVVIEGLTTQDNINEPLFRQTIVAAPRTRFKNIPNISLSTREYEYVQDIGYDKSGNPTSISLVVYKKI